MTGLSKYALVFMFLSCAGSGSTDKAPFPYRLEKPSKTITLSEELNEISGLCLAENQGTVCIATIQDEKADVYFLDTSSASIINSFDFGKNGDFEGISCKGSKFYILRSDGEISISKHQGKAKEYKFKDNKDFDFEGLCLDPKNQRLLVACKEHGVKKKNEFIYIYGFDIKEKKYERKPIFKTKKTGLLEGFKPSGIAIHPSGDIYILSSFSKKLLVLDHQGNTKFIQHLDENIFFQPEGICFDQKGDLYISNEKHNRYPTLLKFNHE